MVEKRNAFIVPLVILQLIIMLLIIGCSKKEDSPIQKEKNEEKNVPGWYYSNYLNGSRYIQLILPNDYDSTDTKKYHTIYLLDSNWYLDGSSGRIDNGGLNGVIEGLVNNEIIDDVIIVGICNYNEYIHSTRGIDFHSEKTINFYNFITQDLIPTIDSRYNTSTYDNNRTLIGHSSAGYFTMYSFFKYDTINYNPFHNFVCLSGDFYKEISNLFLEEGSFADKIGTGNEVKMSLFLAVGSEEEERFLSSYTKMKDSLISRQFEHFKIEGKIYEDHGHSSFLSEAFLDGLTFVLN